MQTLNSVSLKSTNTQHENKHMHRATILRKLHTPSAYTYANLTSSWPPDMAECKMEREKWKKSHVMKMTLKRKVQGRRKHRSLHIPIDYRGSHSGRLVLPAYMPAFDSTSLWILSIGPVGVQAGVRGSQGTRMQSLSQTHIHKLIQKNNMKG